MIDRLLEETDRRRRRLAQRFARTASVSERFAISRELGRLLEVRRTILLDLPEPPTQTA